MATELKASVHLRQYPRMAVNFPVTFVVEGSSLTQTGRSLDIGGGGIAFESEANIAANRSLTISFELRPGLKLQVSGRGAESRHDPASGKYRHRIAFVGLPNQTRDAILSDVFERWRASLPLE